MQKRTETVEESGWVETTEVYGEEEIEAVSPLFIIANKRSVVNMTIDPIALVRSQRENQEFSLMCLWRHGCTRTYLTTTSLSVTFRRQYTPLRYSFVFLNYSDSDSD